MSSFSLSAITALTRELNATTNRIRALEAALLSKSKTADDSSSQQQQRADVNATAADATAAAAAAAEAAQAQQKDLALRMDRLDAALDKSSPSQQQQDVVVKALSVRIDRIDAALEELNVRLDQLIDC